MLLAAFDSRFITAQHTVGLMSSNFITEKLQDQVFESKLSTYYHSHMRDHMLLCQGVRYLKVHFGEALCNRVALVQANVYNAPFLNEPI